MNEPRKTIPEQLMEAEQEIARLRAENQPTKALLAQLAEVRGQLETAKAANSALLTRIAALQAAQNSKQETAAVTSTTATAPIPSSGSLQSEVASLEAAVAKKKSELAAARVKYDCVEIGRLEGELANARAALLTARTKLDHARLDAESAARINNATRAGTLRSSFDREDSDQARQADVIANVTAKLKTATTLQEQIAEGYREKLGIT